MNQMLFGLSTCIFDHLLANVYADKRHLWTGQGCFYKPTTCPTTNIEYTTEDSRVGLLWQDTTHHCCDHLILDLQTVEFFLVLSVLNKISTRILSHLDTLLQPVLALDEHGLSLYFSFNYSISASL